MTISKNRGGFTLVELLVVIAIIGTLVGLLLPAVQSAREAARRSACTNNMKQLCLSVMNFESARKRLPTASTGVGTNSGAQTGSFSWIALILPFMEETNLYTTISSNSNRLCSAYSLNTTAAQTSLPQVVCPSFAGNKKAATTQTAGIPSDGVTNYKAISGAGFTGTTPYTAGNLGGVITVEKYGSESTAPYTGISLAQITDGTSKCFMIGETKEGTKAAWIDGPVCWLTASNGGANAGSNGGSASLPASTFLAILDNTKTAGTFTGYGGTDYGTSSFHQAGITLHGYADGHVAQVTPEIDSGLMLNLHTRAGAEPVADAP
jgi:prepilin-type N-terminal cleavage/methylation domain-containing protein